MNNICIVGRLTTTPELKSTPNGTNVCNFTLAVERRFKDTSGNPVTDFIDCVAWKHNAEFLGKWFDKGVRVAITGELQTRSYEKDGQKHKVSEVLVSTVEFADGKREANATFDVASMPSDEFIPIDNDDDLPFPV